MNTNQIIENIESTPNNNIFFDICIITVAMLILVDFLYRVYKTLENCFLYGDTIVDRKYKNKVYDVYLTPMQVGFLLNGKITFNHIVATILQFLDKGIISLEKIYRKDGTVAYRFAKKEVEFCDYYLYSGERLNDERINNLKKRGITLSEVYTIDKIIFKYYSNINADRIFELYDNYDDYSKLYKLKPIDERDELYEELRKVKCLLLCELNEKYGEFGENYKKYKGLDVEYLRPSKVYKSKIKEINDYKDKLQNDTLLSERNIESVYLWGEHLIYGVALGVCKTSIKDAIKIYEGKRKA